MRLDAGADNQPQRVVSGARLCGHQRLYPGVQEVVRFATRRLAPRVSTSVTGFFRVIGSIEVLRRVLVNAEHRRLRRHIGVDV